MKKILFAVNTLGRAGAETALLEMLKRLEGQRIEGQELEIFLYVIMSQGEMCKNLPPYVKLLNERFNSESVLTGRGKRTMMRRVARAFFRNGGFFGKLHYVMRQLSAGKKAGSPIRMDKLLWRVLSDGARRFEEEFDLAVAWLEGASAYYVADHVRAKKKAAFIHIDYESAGYTREMDRGCWERFDRIFAVSQEARGHFLAVCPEYERKTEVFHNMLNQEAIKSRALEGEGFTDGFQGMRLLTVGRLTYQKAYDIAVEAMKLLKDSGCKVRWYVLGEGDQRKVLEKKIAQLGLSEDFILLGAVENPYPYYLQADLYVHATRFEGKSIAVQEAQILGCAVLASDCNGNREQIEDGRDGMLTSLEPEAIAESVLLLLQDEGRRRKMGLAAAEKQMPQGREELARLLLLASSTIP